MIRRARLDWLRFCEGMSTSGLPDSWTPLKAVCLVESPREDGSPKWALHDRRDQTKRSRQRSVGSSEPICSGKTCSMTGLTNLVDQLPGYETVCPGGQRRAPEWVTARVPRLPLSTFGPECQPVCRSSRSA
jgi:hypothetical protein